MSAIPVDGYRGTEEMIYAGGALKSWSTLAEMKSRECETRTSSEKDFDVAPSSSLTDSAASSGSPPPGSNGVESIHQLEDGKHQISSTVSTEVSYAVNSAPFSILPQKDVVRIRNACKSYGGKGGSTRVLSNLKMTVKERQIYGLLGASGCGKTTLLSCLLGLHVVDGGSVAVFGGTPGDRRGIGIPGRRVGYMPQETALFKEFNIRETFNYFGRVYGMELEEVGEQKRFLADLLDLPHENSRIANLSGGQQRRVSFAVSLMHRPELLILDEPTVGVDPMLRKSIWSYLSKLSSDNSATTTTIIMTTHYVEEARQCDVVGLMNDGAMLAEECPSKLMNDHGVATLEDVFLNLCVKQRSESDLGAGTENSGYVDDDRRVTGRQIYPGMTASLDDLSIQPLSYCKSNVERVPSLRMSSLQGGGGGNSTAFSGWGDVSCRSALCLSLSRTWALTAKNLIKLKRSIPNLLFSLLVPVLQISLFCLAVGRQPFDLKFGVVNDEVPGDGGGTCDYYEGCHFENISCRILSSLTNEVPRMLDLLQFDTEREALEASKRGEIWGFMRFRRNFSLSVVSKMLNLDDYDGNASRVEVRLDMSNQQVGISIQSSLNQHLQTVSKTLLSNCSLDVGLVEPPVAFGQPVYGNGSDFTSFMVPGVIVTIIFFMAVGLTGQAFIQERQDGLLRRSWIAGVTPFELVAAQLVTQFLVLVFQCSMAILFTLVVFRIECLGKVYWVVLVCLLQGLAGMSYGFLLSAACRNESLAIQVAIGTFFPMLVLSGILWPLEGMPLVLRKAAQFLPCTLATQAVRDIMTRGWGISVVSVYLGVVSSTAWIIAFLLTSWLLVKYVRW